MDLLVPTLLMVLVIAVGLALVLTVARWGRKKEQDPVMFDFKGFTPGELERLIDQGLLTDSEAKKIRNIVAERSVEAMHKKEMPQEPPPDLNTLLSEAERHRRERLKEAPSDSGDET